MSSYELPEGIAKEVRAPQSAFLRDLRSFYGEIYDQGGRASWGAYASPGHWGNTQRWAASARGLIAAAEKYTGSRPDSVLELGCGPGVMTLELQKLGVNAYGLDWGGQRRAPGTITASALGIPFAVAFDLVVALDVIEHIPIDFHDLFFRELRRVAADALAVTVPTSEPHFVLDSTRGFRNHYVSETPEWWAEHFRRFGWRVIAQGELSALGAPFAWGRENFPFFLRKISEDS